MNRQAEGCSHVFPQMLLLLPPLSSSTPTKNCASTYSCCPFGAAQRRPAMPCVTSPNTSTSMSTALHTFQPRQRHPPCCVHPPTKQPL
ncbi:hypothetical protein COO60DRAFT_216886 [Scenedesmus sp. NREL 46B-D3]|nr:hypothetical protein COO60DRAFT_216886 [Scenedesmus sp. NREL 46B-D3]